MITPGFHTWTIIFLLASFQASAIACLLFLTRRGNKNANKILAIFIGLFGITLLHYVVFWTGYIKIYPHFTGLSNCFPFLYGPLLFIYFRELNLKPYKHSHWFHFLPFLAHFLYLLPFYLLSTQEKLDLLEEVNISQLAFIPWFQIIHLLIYAFLIYKINSQASEFRKWSNTLLIAYLGFVLSFMSYYILILHPQFSLSWDYMISGAMTIFIFIVALMGYIQPEIFSGKSIKEVIRVAKYGRSSLTPRVANVLLPRLDQIMIEEKMYGDPKLNLEYLAGIMNISKHELSQLINEYKGKSFSDYVNEIRVNIVIEQLQHFSNTDIPAIQLAYDAGFNNKVSFYQHFKKITGKTPGQYRKMVNDYRN